MDNEGKFGFHSGCVEHVVGCIGAYPTSILPQITNNTYRLGMVYIGEPCREVACDVLVVVSESQFCKIEQSRESGQWNVMYLNEKFRDGWTDKASCLEDLPVELRHIVIYLIDESYMPNPWAIQEVTV